MMSHMPAIVVRAAVPQDFDAIIDLVAGMFQDLGTPVFLDAWRHDLQQALASRLWSDVAAFVAVDRADMPIAVAVGIIDQRLPSPDGLRARLATSNGSRQLPGQDGKVQLEPPRRPYSDGSMSTR
jgi:hypothetical protein